MTIMMIIIVRMLQLMFNTFEINTKKIETAKLQTRLISKFVELQKGVFVVAFFLSKVLFFTFFCYFMVKMAGKKHSSPLVLLYIWQLIYFLFFLETVKVGCAGAPVSTKKCSFLRQLQLQQFHHWNSLCAKPTINCPCLCVWADFFWWPGASLSFFEDVHWREKRGRESN